MDTLFGCLVMFALLIVVPAAIVWLLVRIYGDVPENERFKRADVRICVECGYDLRASADVCPECGTKQPYCVSCGNRVFRSDDETCPTCGAKAGFLTQNTAE